MTSRLIVKRIGLAIALVLLAGRLASAQTFPTVRGSVTTGVDNTSQTSHAITLPGHVVGDLLLVVFTVDTAPSITVNTGVSGTGWGLSPSGACSGSTVCGKLVWEVAATAAEALTLTTSTSVPTSYIAYAIQNAGTPAFATTNGNSTDTDPPSLTPAGGSADYLWIVSRHGDANVVATAAPTNFTNLETAAGNSAGVSTNTARREFTGTVLDPGVFTSATEQWGSVTTAIPYVFQAQSTTTGQLILGVGQ